MVRIIFLDIDGVLNGEIFYNERHRKRLFTFQHWWWALTSRIKWIFNGFKYKATTLQWSPKKQKEIDKKYARFDFRFERFKEETSIKQLRWLDETCKNVNAKIVISSTWRTFFTIEEWNKVFLWLELDNIEVIGITGYSDDRIRGHEIKAYLDEHKEVEDFVIIDDDSDILVSQRNNFFPTDVYCGLTPSVLHRIERHFRKESEYLCGVSIAKDYL
jgi:hypothetical protein